VNAVPSYDFRRVELADLPMLNGWLRHPHVAEWWGDAAMQDADELADPRCAMWIVSLGGAPFAYMQDYDVHGWEGHHFRHLPPGSRGIDQYIADPAMLNGGHGTAFIRQRLDVMFECDVPAIGTDPHPENARAIAAYRKAGFRMTGGPVDTLWGLALLMQCDRSG
jgi:aminoglycoside 6'-N-acetyltransferase